MFVAGLTGGIGSGKSTLAALLAERGAQIIDADLLGRDALKPGRPAWHSVVDQFGDDILVRPSMEIDRQRLAGIVFSQREKLTALNAIVHPVIVKGIADRIDKLRLTNEIVVVDAALLVELGLHSGMDAVIVIVADPSTRRARIEASRELARDDIQMRMAAQSSDEALLERADIVVRNDGTLKDLVREADRVWSLLVAMAKG